MKIGQSRLSRYVCLFTAVTLAGIAIAPLFDQTVFAGGQVQARSIELSDSTPSATGVTYNVSFKPTASTTVGGIIVDFCADSPIIGSTTCTYPTAFTMGSTASVTVTSGIGTGGSWTTTNSLQCSAAASNIQTLKYTNVTAQSVTAGTPVIFTINTVSNPSTTGTFYARIYTFDTSANAVSNYTCSGTTRGGSLSGELDFGGIALSTVTQISITATVQETLSFCVSGSSISGTCSGLTAPSLIIGTGTPSVLDTSGEGTQAFTQLSTNASTGVIVRMKATNACTNGGLSTAAPDSSGGCLSVPGVGSSASTFNASGSCGASAACYGMCVAPGSGVTANANYLDTTNGCGASFSATSEYGMDGANVTGTYGDPIYSTGGAVNAISSTLTFAARAANTTPAGVYQGNEILIATGTF
jgi:hypothetical protein